MADYYIGQKFIDTYPVDAAIWCEENNAYIDTLAKVDNKNRFEIKEQDPPSPIDVDTLTMTPLDFIGVLVNFGLTLEQINVYLESNLNVKIQLTYCNNVFCGVVKGFLPITIGSITITTAMVEQAFKIKNGVA